MTQKKPGAAKQWAIVGALFVGCSAVMSLVGKKPGESSMPAEQPPVAEPAPAPSPPATAATPEGPRYASKPTGIGSDVDKPRRVECKLTIPGSTGGVPLFPTEDGFSEWALASARGDTEAAGVAAVANGAVLVARGSRCSMLDVGILGPSKVRVVSGAHQGLAGYVPTEWTRGD